MHISSILTLAGLALPVFSRPTKTLEKRTARTSAPSDCLTVGSSATYSSLSSALDSLGSSTSAACIFIESGTYSEQVTIDYGGALTIYGYTTNTASYKSNAVTITNTISSEDAGSLDESSTINIVSDSVSLYNINVENGYGSGAQAVALTGNADQLGFYGCQFLGYQDTLYAKSGTQYYSNCYIEGAVDYIFGDASAWFGECVIASSGAGSITANSREESDDSAWYVIDSSTVRAKSGVSLSGEVYLGRPWRVLARVMYQNSELSDVINEAGWTTMADDATPLYYEYNNSGDGADTSAREYETTATAAVTHATVLGSDYTSWVDTDY